jgi:hypothetical protein
VFFGPVAPPLVQTADHFPSVKTPQAGALFGRFAQITEK